MPTARETRLVEMKGALAEKGVSLTPRRSRLLEALIDSRNHPGVSEIHQDVRRYFPGTSLATIYNTIDLLKDAGQVLEIEFSGAANRYDGWRPEPHTHLICDECGRIEDLDMEEVSEPIEAISASTGYEVTHSRSDYYGVCPDCKGRSNHGGQK